MVAHAALSKRYWAEAVSTACYIKNRSPSQSLAGHITRYEAWYGRKPDLSDLNVFGCMPMHISQMDNVGNWMISPSI